MPDVCRDGPLMFQNLLLFLIFLLSHVYRDQLSHTVHKVFLTPLSSSPTLSPPLQTHQLQQQLGEHILVEIKSAPAEGLNHLESLKQAIIGVLKQANLTVVAIQGHQFAPQGVSVVAVLSESHLSIHTWPELGYAALDVYTCGLDVVGRAEAAATGIVAHLQAKEYHMSIVRRGIPLPTFLTATTHRHLDL